MSSEPVSSERNGHVPAPIDESWWSAVLRDEERHGPGPARRTTPLGADHAASPRSAEDWSWARQVYELDEVVELAVVGFNRGGLLVEANSLRGFVPVSHLVSIQQDPAGRNSPEALAGMIGRKLPLKVIELDPQRGRLVFSERAALAGPGRRVALFSSLEPGQIAHGTVTNITRFGVFVDLGGVEGLVHVSEISWGRVAHPADVVACGEELTVRVLSVDREKGRVALSLKELRPDPWSTVEVRYRVGQVVEGVVTSVVKFGAFVGIEEGLEGLVHLSELGEGSFLDPHGVVREGEKVRARVIHLDAASRRIGLSIRQVSQWGDDAERPDEVATEREALSSY